MDYQSSVEDIDEITKQISVSVPKELVAKEYESSLTQVGRTARLNGFRPGKVPRHMVEKMMGPRVRVDVAQKLINDALREIYKANSLEVVGEPEIDIQNIEPAAPLEFKAKVALFPQPVISNYKQRSVEVTRRIVADADVEKAVNQLLDSRAQLQPIEERKVAQTGDVVALSVGIAVEGAAPGRPEPFVDELGAGRLDASVEAQLAGTTVGESKEITAVAGDEHPNVEVRGKSVTYSITLHGLFGKTLPELNDEFAVSSGMGVENVEQLREKIRADLTKRAEDEMKVDAQGALLDLLVNENQFRVPQVMVDEEIRGIVARYSGQTNVNPETIDVAPFRSQFQEFALNRIRCAVIIDRVGSAEEVKVDEVDRDSMIQKVADQNGATVEQARKALLDKTRIMSFLLEVRRTKILEHLLANTTVTYKDPEGEQKAA